MRLFTATVIGFLSICCSRANADWQWTRWGMTPQEVMEASKNTLRETSEAEFQIKSGKNKENQIIMASRLLGAYEAPDFQFAANFLFDPKENKLICVYLDLLNGNLKGRLEGELRSTYGTPHRSENVPLLNFSMLAWYAQDEVKFMSTGNSATLSYCQRRAGGL